LNIAGFLDSKIKGKNPSVDKLLVEFEKFRVLNKENVMVRAGTRAAVGALLYSFLECKFKNVSYRIAEVKSLLNVNFDIL